MAWAARSAVNLRHLVAHEAVGLQRVVVGRPRHAVGVGRMNEEPRGRAVRGSPSPRRVGDVGEGGVAPGRAGTGPWALRGRDRCCDCRRAAILSVQRSSDSVSCTGSCAPAASFHNVALAPRRRTCSECGPACAQAFPTRYQTVRGRSQRVPSRPQRRRACPVRTRGRRKGGAMSCNQAVAAETAGATG